MSRRSRNALRYALGFTWTVFCIAFAVWLLTMSLVTMWSQCKTERLMERCSTGLRDLNDRIAILCGVISFEGRTMRASWLPAGDKGRTVTYSSGHCPLVDKDVPAPFFRYTNKYDFGRIGDERDEVKSLNVTVGKGN